MREFVLKQEQAPKDNTANQTVRHLPQKTVQTPETTSENAATTSFAYDFSRIPVHRAEKPIQTKLSISEQSDAHEQEADRMANRAMSGQTLPKSSQQVVSGNGDSMHKKALETADRKFFESRFNHNFADVRIHTDSKANEFALGLGARANTVGSSIYFAPGEYRPGTYEGRHLLAHELSHVIQQKNISRSDSLIIQRQPKDAAPPPPPPPPKQKTLKDEGVSLSDPATSNSALIIDAVLQRNKRLAPFIGDRLKGGFRIAEKGKFVVELSNSNFDSEYNTTYNQPGSSFVDPKTMGFYDYQKSVIHLRPSAEFGTALHEAVHRLASPGLYTIYLQHANKVSKDLTKVLAEGMTAFFTDCILRDEGMPKHIDAYSSWKQKAEDLIKAFGADGFRLMAQFNFKGDNIIEIGNRLGLTTQEFVALRNGGIKEVMKRLNKLL